MDGKEHGKKCEREGKNVDLCRMNQDGKANQETNESNKSYPISSVTRVIHVSFYLFGVLRPIRVLSVQQLMTQMPPWLA